MSAQGQPAPFPRHLLHQAPESRLDSFGSVSKVDMATPNAFDLPYVISIYLHF